MDSTQSSRSESESTSAFGVPFPQLAEFFRYERDKDEKNVIYKCQLCLPKQKLLSVNRKSTYNMKAHIKSVHPGSLERFTNQVLHKTKVVNVPVKQSLKPDLSEPQAPQPEADIDSSQGETAEEECSSAKRRKRQPSMDDMLSTRKVSQSTIDNKIVDFVIDCMLPLEVVESAKFQSLIQTLVPGKTVMSRRSLTRMIEARFYEYRENLKQHLSKVDHVSTTADAWTCRNRSYLGMTIHYIDADSFERKKHTIACKRIKGRHTYDKLTNEMMSIHSMYGVEDKVISTTTDNGSNFVKAFRVYADDSDTAESLPETKEQLAGIAADDAAGPSSSKEDIDEDAVTMTSLVDVLNSNDAQDVEVGIGYLPKHHRCAAHTLNLVASVDSENALDDDAAYKRVYRSAFGKARDLWTKQSRSSVISDALQDELGRKLTVPTVTRWNSVFDSVVVLVGIFNSKMNNLVRLCTAHNLPKFTQGEVAFLKEYSLVMKPVAVSLDVLQGEDRAFMGILLPTVTITIQKLKALNNLVYCAPLVTSLISGIEKRFQPQLQDLNYQLAAAFHPMFKLQWTDDDGIISRVSTRMAQLINEELSVESNSSSTDDEEDFFRDMHMKVKPRNQGHKLVMNYLDGPASRMKPSLSSFPSPAFNKHFIKLNTPIPSSAAVERIFSLGKDVLRPKRSSLSDEHFEMLVLLKSFI